MRFRLFVLAIGALSLVSMPVFADAVDLSSLRYDFGAGADLVTFAVNNGVNPDANDSFSTTQTFDVATHGGDNKHALTADVWGSETDLTGFASLDLTIEVDPASAVDAFGNHGFFQVAGRNTDSYDYISLIGLNLVTGTNVISAPLDAMNAARALTFDLYGGPSQDITGDIIFDVVDVTLVVPEPTSGLMCFAVLAGLGMLRRR